MEHSDPQKRTPDSREAPAERPSPTKPSQGGYGHDSREGTEEEGRTGDVSGHKKENPRRPL